jgi:hypothetical protein
MQKYALCLVDVGAIETLGPGQAVRGRALQNLLQGVAGTHEIAQIFAASITVLQPPICETVIDTR